MKKLFFIITAIFFSLTLFSCQTMGVIDTAVSGRADEYLGEEKMCLDTVRIKESRILDDQTILFEMRGSAFYINRLPVPCHGLRIGGGFSYSSSIAKLCSQDSIKVISRGSEPTTTCMLGDFVKVEEEGRIDQIAKMLRDGLLEDLVEEGAFK